MKIVSSAISRCEEMLPKFADGTSQHTLLKNRIKALYISRLLLSDEYIAGTYSIDELTKAQQPISSIISKCEKAQLKHEEGTSYHIRFKNMINAMRAAESLIASEIINCKNQ